MQGLTKALYDDQKRSVLEEREYNERILSRDEEFQLRVLELKLNAFNRFTDTVKDLAVAIANRKPPVVINVLGDDLLKTEGFKALLDSK